MTRRLLAAGQRPVTVGLFFSLGHSTVVVITSLVVAATSSAISSKFDDFSRVGGIIGVSVSAIILILLAIMNFFVRGSFARPCFYSRYVEVSLQLGFDSTCSCIRQ